VRTYSITHGKGNNTPLKMWMINAKYVTDPRGVYVPRKMRLHKYQGGTAGRRGRRGRPGRWVFTAYGIHGTNQPWVIGTMASHGCIRMYNWDILELWPHVPLGTMTERGASLDTPRDLHVRRSGLCARPSSWTHPSGFIRNNP
jgi:L,D-transpeptidase ErfK/SrfK